MSAAETVKKSCIIPGHCKAPIVVPMLTRQIKQFKNTGSVTNVISLQHEHPIRPIQNIAIVEKIQLLINDQVTNNKKKLLFDQQDEINLKR